MIYFGLTYQIHNFSHEFKKTSKHIKTNYET
jgi:hypothetical protein